MRLRPIVGWLGAALLAGAALASPGPAGHGHHHPPDFHRGGPDGHRGPPPGDERPPFAVDPNPSTYRPLPRTDMLIVHATLLDGAGGRMNDAEVLVRSGRIVAVGHGLASDRSGLTIVDARGRFLTPGVIDPHSHDGTYVLPLTSIDEKASDVSEISEPIDAEDWIQHAINPQDPGFPLALQSGVTAMLVLPGSDPLMSGRTVVLKPVPATNVDAMKFPDAPEGMKMACGENPKETFGSIGRAPNSRQGEIAMLRQAFLRAQDYERAWRHHHHEHGRDDDDDDDDHGPRRDLRLEALAAILDGEVRVQIHCYRADEMVVMLDLAREFGFHIAAFHHAMEGYKIAPLLAETGTCAAVWSDWWGYKMEALDGIRENAAFIDAAGGCVAMHSDSPIVGQRLNVDAGIAAAAGRRAGIDLPPERVIRWITSGPARILGLQDRIGTVAPGYDADLVIWSGDPFSVYTHADLVFIDGALAWDRAHPPAEPTSDFELGRAPPMVAAR